MNTVESCGGKFTILSLDDALADDFTIRAWREFSRVSDVYFDLNYLRLEATRLGSSVHLSTFVLGNEVVLRTHLVRPIRSRSTTMRRYVDFITPFEFGGPITLPSGLPPSKKLIELSQNAMNKYCTEQGIISEFVRFHPLLQNSNHWAKYYQLREVGDNYLIDLKLASEEIIQQYSRSQLRNIRRAQLTGAYVQKIPLKKSNIDIVQHLYNENQARLNNPAEYCFASDYFSALDQSVEKIISLYLCRSVLSKPVSALMVLCGNKYSHSHLIGSDPKFRTEIPNSLLYHEAAMDLKGQGLRYFHLGGAGEKQHGVRAFKKGLSTGAQPYFVGTKIYDQKVYTQLCKDAGASKLMENSEFFPLYRIFENS